MALKLVLPPNSPLLLDGSAQYTDYYIKIVGWHFLPLTGQCAIVLGFKLIGADNLPIGDWLARPPLPTLAPVMRPAELMMTAAAAYGLVYTAAHEYLVAKAGEGVTVQNLI